MKNLLNGTKIIVEDELCMKVSFPDYDEYYKNHIALRLNLNTGKLRLFFPMHQCYQVVDISFTENLDVIDTKDYIENIPTGTYFKIYPNSEYLFIKIDCCLLTKYNAINVCTGEVLYLFPDREVVCKSIKPKVKQNV